MKLVLIPNEQTQISKNIVELNLILMYNRVLTMFSIGIDRVSITKYVIQNILTMFIYYFN